MSTVDICVLLIVGVSCLLGVFRGFVKEALSLVYWTGAAVAAGLFSGKVGYLLSGAISSPTLQKVVAFILIFILVVFVGGLISNGISKLLSKAGLGPADRALGAVFGIIRGVVIVTVIVTLTGKFSFTEKYYSQSVTVPYVMTVSNSLQKLLGITPAENEKVRDAVISA
jgi:membrane protein required for colicin V production